MYYEKNIITLLREKVTQCGIHLITSLAVCYDVNYPPVIPDLHAGLVTIFQLLLAQEKVKRGLSCRFVAV